MQPFYIPYKNLKRWLFVRLLYGQENKGEMLSDMTRVMWVKNGRGREESRLVFHGGVADLLPGCILRM